MPHLSLHVKRATPHTQLSSSHIPPALMNSNTLALYFRSLLQPSKEHRHSPVSKRLTIISQEHRVITSRSIITSENRPMTTQVLMQRFKPIPRHWYLLPLIPLTMHQ